MLPALATGGSLGTSLTVTSSVAMSHPPSLPSRTWSETVRPPVELNVHVTFFAVDWTCSPSLRLKSHS